MKTLLLLLATAFAAQAQFGFVRQRWSDSGSIVQMAGWPQANWAANYGLAGTNTIGNNSSTYRARIAGPVDHFRVWVNTANGTWTVNQLRGTATNVFDLVSSVNWASGSGTNVVPGSGLILDEGDLVAVTVPNSTARLQMSNAGGSGYYSAQAVASGYTFTNKVEDGCNFGAWGKGPAIAFTGDSIQTGFPNYVPHLASDSTNGLASNSAPWKLTHEFGQRSNYGNYCRGGQTWAWVLSTAMPAITNDNPAAVWFNCGVNDVGTGRTWAAVESDMNAVRAMWPKGKPFYVASILPWTGASDAQALSIRTFNSNMLAWCKLNSARYVDLWTDFGTNRVSTSMPDNLKPEYNIGDDVHLSTAGIARYAWHYRRALTHSTK